MPSFHHTTPTADVVESAIREQIEHAFAPVYFALHNDSHGHATASDFSHFRVLIVSNHFGNKSRVKRHQMVYATLADEMQIIHALAIQAYTPDEWNTHPDNHAAADARTPPSCAKNR